MNERIKQLAEQAWDHVDAHCPYASEEQEMFQEKFAELLIEETRKICSENMGYSEYIAMRNRVQSHFGIEK